MNLSTTENLLITDHLLMTTRSVRKRLDLTRPVEPEIVERCIEISIQAPTGSNRQTWHFMVITDAEKRAAIGGLYRKSFESYRGPRDQPIGEQDANDPHAAQTRRVIDSAQYLSDQMHEVPLFIIPCIEGRVENAGLMNQAGLYGSILPATWSLMMALRARGLGTAWTTLHLRYEKETAEILEIPDHITQAALLPVAYFKGEDFKPAKRLSARERTYWDGWGQGRG